MEFKSEEELKKFICENVITTKEVATIKGCTKQYISKLVKEEKLIPLKKTDREMWFWKNDIK